MLNINSSLSFYKKHETIFDSASFIGAQSLSLYLKNTIFTPMGLGNLAAAGVHALSIAGFKKIAYHFDQSQGLLIQTATTVAAIALSTLALSYFITTFGMPTLIALNFQNALYTSYFSLILKTTLCTAHHFSHSNHKFSIWGFIKPSSIEDQSAQTSLSQKNVTPFPSFFVQRETLDFSQEPPSIVLNSASDVIIQEETPKEEVDSSISLIKETPTSLKGRVSKNPSYCKPISLLIFLFTATAYLLYPKNEPLNHKALTITGHLQHLEKIELPKDLKVPLHFFKRPIHKVNHEKALILNETSSQNKIFYFVMFIISSIAFTILGVKGCSYGRKRKKQENNVINLNNISKMRIVLPAAKQNESLQNQSLLINHESHEESNKQILVEGKENNRKILNLLLKLPGQWTEPKNAFNCNPRVFIPGTNFIYQINDPKFMNQMFKKLNLLQSKSNDNHDKNDNNIEKNSKRLPNDKKLEIERYKAQVKAISLSNDNHDNHSKNNEAQVKAAKNNNDLLIIKEFYKKSNENDNAENDNADDIKEDIEILDDIDQIPEDPNSFLTQAISKMQAADQLGSNAVIEYVTYLQKKSDKRFAFIKDFLLPNKFNENKVKKQLQEAHADQWIMIPFILKRSSKNPLSVDHIVLMMIDKETKKIYYYNSQGTRWKKESRNVLHFGQSVKQLLKKIVAPNFLGYRFEDLKKWHQKAFDNKNCGAFVCHCINHIVTTNKLLPGKKNFSISNRRKAMAQEMKEYLNFQQIMKKSKPFSKETATVLEDNYKFFKKRGKESLFTQLNKDMNRDHKGHCKFILKSVNGKEEILKNANQLYKALLPVAKHDETTTLKWMSLMQQGVLSDITSKLQLQDFQDSLLNPFLQKGKDSPIREHKVTLRKNNKLPLIEIHAKGAIVNDGGETRAFIATSTVIDLNEKEAQFSWKEDI